jgi:hypothetical protein
MVDYKELGNLNGCPFLLLLIFRKFFGIIFLESKKERSFSNDSRVTASSSSYSKDLCGAKCLQTMSDEATLLENAV